MATTFETASASTETRSLSERLTDWATRRTRSLQMSQMIRALAQLNDEQLTKVGLTRAEIPAHAYRVVYQNG